MSAINQIVLGLSGGSAWDFTTLAMHMNDVGLTDEKGHAVTLNGNAARSSVQSVFGGYSAGFDGNNDYLAVATGANYFGTGDFTIVARIYLTSLRSDVMIYDGGGGASNRPTFKVLSTGALHSSSNGGGAVQSGAGLITTGSWFHVLVSRKLSTTRLFINGAHVGSVADSQNYTGGSSCRIGMSSFGSYDMLDGYIDELLVIRGLALYTADFTVPTSPFENF